MPRPREDTFHLKRGGEEEENEMPPNEIRDSVGDGHELVTPKATRQRPRLESGSSDDDNDGYGYGGGHERMWSKASSGQGGEFARNFSSN